MQTEVQPNPWKCHQKQSGFLRHVLLPQEERTETLSSIDRNNATAGEVGIKFRCEKSQIKNRNDILVPEILVSLEKVTCFHQSLELYT